LDVDMIHTKVIVINAIYNFVVNNTFLHDIFLRLKYLF